MKPKYHLYLSALLFVALLLNVSAARAQVIEPPLEENGESSQDVSPDFGIKENGERQTSATNRDIVPVSNILHIADESENEEKSSVAYGYSEYGIAYLVDSEIYVSFFRYDGLAIGNYEISGTTGNASWYPDIAFEGSSGLFVVTWQSQESNYDVLCRAVHPQLGPQGSIIEVASTSASEMGPALDCNHNDGSCLVAFAYHETYDSIQGRFMNVSSSGVSAPAHSAFTIINNGNYLRQPFVAWGWNAGTYGIVVQDYDANPDIGLYTHVYDTYQSGGYQTLHGQVLMTPSEWTDHNIEPTGLTYDPCTENYLALFTHDFEGNGSDLDIYLKPFSADSTYKVSDPITIAYTGDIEELGAISFMTNAWAAQYGIGPDEIAVAYYNYDDGILTTIIKGNCSTSNPEYTVRDEGDHVVVREVGYPTFSINEPSVSGSSGNGEYMVTWTDENDDIAVNSDDIYGRIFFSEKLGFLPLILK